MESRARFESICNRQRPDRFPIDYLAHPRTDERLKQFYGVDNESALLDALGADFYYLSCRDISQNESCFPFYKGPTLEVSDDQRVCPFGIRWSRSSYNSKFAVDDALAGPLQNATSESDILEHAWPQADWFDFDSLVAEAEANAQRVIVGGLWSGILGDSYRMIGFENFLLNMAMNPALIKTLVNRMTDFYLEMNDAIFTLLKGKLDIYFFGNDFGSQGGLLFGQDMFGDLFLPNIKRLVALAHQYDLKVMMHSCGAIADLIPLLIEAGVDILDPVQPTAQGMEPRTLADRFGDAIIFHGGIDTQELLINAAPEEVARTSAEVIAALGMHNNYIFAPSQVLQPDVPVENIDAMYRIAREGI